MLFDKYLGILVVDIIYHVLRIVWQKEFLRKCIEKIISKNEFQELWYSCLARFSKQWKSVKTKYKIGSNVLGRVEYYYPQGIILKGTDFTALYRGKNNYRLHEEVSVRIVKYDDDNMWFVVE